MTSNERVTHGAEPEQLELSVEDLAELMEHDADIRAAALALVTCPCSEHGSEFHQLLVRACRKRAEGGDA